MRHKQKRVVIALLLLLAGILVLVIDWAGPDMDSAGSGAGPNDTDVIAVEAMESSGGKAANTKDATSGRRDKIAKAGAGLTGIVIEAASGRPLPDVLVSALDRPPAFSGMELRLENLLKLGFWKPRAIPLPRVLAVAKSGADGRFLLEGLPSGRFFLEAHSSSYYSRAPFVVRLAVAEQREGVELLVHRGALVKGKVLGPTGDAVGGARVVLRPDANAFLAQLSTRSYRWFETNTDVKGLFEFPGVPQGEGYALSAMAKGMAMAVRRNLSVPTQGTVECILKGSHGAVVRGTVRFADGSPATGAYVAFAYLDLSRILFSIDGENPVMTDQDGRFLLPNVGSGELVFGAVKDLYALAKLEFMDISDGGSFELDFVLDEGEKVKGRVVDSHGQAVMGAKVSARVMNRPTRGGFDLSIITQLRPFEAQTDAEGRFTLRGMESGPMFINAEKSGYLPANRMLRSEEEQKQEILLTLEVGAYISGHVIEKRSPMDVGDKAARPVKRFRVSGRSARDGGRNRTGVPLAAASGREGGAATERNRGRGRRRGSSRERWRRAFASMLREGGNWNPFSGGSFWAQNGVEEIKDPKGRFRVGPFKAGKVRLRVTAEGFLSAESQEVEVVIGKETTGVLFELSKGSRVTGHVFADGKPLAEAQLTWERHRAGSSRARWLPIQIDFGPTDLDFMAYSSFMSPQSVLSDKDGKFEFTAVPEGRITISARHPSYAKKKLEQVIEVVKDRNVEGLVLELTKGGSIAGTVFGLDDKPAPAVMVTALSLGRGVVKSAVSNLAGRYEIIALKAGRYILFKTSLDATGAELLTSAASKFRIKTATVKEGEVTHVDLRDRTEGGVDLFGRVLVKGVPAPKAMIGLFGQDKAGPFGIGVRSGSADKDGQYEIASVPPGNYICRLTVFEKGRRKEASLRIQVPAGLTRHHIDLHFPGASLSGRVTDESGKAISGVRLVAVSESIERVPSGLLGLLVEAGGESRARSARDGSFHVDKLRPGQWKIRAEPRGGAREQFASVELGGLSLLRGQDLSGLQIVLPRASVLEGRIVDGQGQVVVGARVRVWREKDNAAAETNSGDTTSLRTLIGQLRQTRRSDGQGKFRIVGLVAGRWSVEAQKDGYATARKSGLLVQQQAPPVLLRMVKGGHVYLRVTGLDGKALRPGQIKILNSKGEQVGKSKSLFGVLAGLFRQKKEDGGSDWLDMGTLEPDTYRLRVTSRLPGGKSEVREVKKTLREGETVRWEVKYSELVPLEKGN